MADATDRFFAGIARQGYQPLLANVVGSVRFELRNGTPGGGRTLHIDHGDVWLSDAPEADCRITSDRELFNRLATGQTNALAAMLRGAVIVEGSYEMLVLLQRLFPGPKS